MINKKQISRREFIKDSTASATALSAAGLFYSCSKTVKKGQMPKRILGKTGFNVSLLSFGGGSQFLKNKDGDWEPLLEKAIELGINYFDTAPNYQWGASMSSEDRYGKILPRYRDKVIISTKIDERQDLDKAKAEFERSLKRMNTDHVDVLFLHAIGGKLDDVDNIMKSGLFELLVKFKEEKLTRFIGFSAMNSASEAKRAIELMDFDVALMTINPVKAMHRKFAEITVPVGRQKNVGMLAMKVMRNLVGKKATAKELLQYALARQGVATALVSPFGMEVLEENVRLVKEIAAGDTVALDEREIESRLAHMADPKKLYYLDPNYTDGMIV